MVWQSWLINKTKLIRRQKCTFVECRDTKVRFISFQFSKTQANFKNKTAVNHRFHGFNLVVLYSLKN